MNKKYLFINTINPARPSFAIFNVAGYILCSSGFCEKQENLIKELSNFLKKNRILPESISGVLVAAGPGGFSSSRAGVVLANSFNFTSGAAVLGISDEDAATEDLIKNNAAKLVTAKKTARAEIFYAREPV